MSSQAIQMLETMNGTGSPSAANTIRVVPAGGFDGSRAGGYEHPGLHPATLGQKELADKARQVLGKLVDVTLSEPGTRRRSRRSAWPACSTTWAGSLSRTTCCAAGGT